MRRPASRWGLPPAASCNSLANLRIEGMKASLARSRCADVVTPVVESVHEAIPVAPVAGLAELDELLMEHARQSTSLAVTAGCVKATWLDFAEHAPAQHVPAALAMVAQIGRIRGELVDETLRVAEILHGLGKQATTFNVGQAAVLVAPPPRRRGQAK